MHLFCELVFLTRRNQTICKDKHRLVTCHARKEVGNGGVALLILNFVAKVWSTPRRGRFTPRKKLRYSLYRRLCGPQGGSGYEKSNPLAPTGRRNPYRLALSDLLYRLPYPRKQLSHYRPGQVLRAPEG